MLVLRPITSDAARALARQLLERGVPGIEEGPDGRLWALGVERRSGDRRERREGQPDQDARGRRD